MNESFVFYKSWQDALVELPSEIRLEVLDAVIAYATLGQEPQTISLAAKVAFTFMRKQIDDNNERYNNICKKRSEAAKKSVESRNGKCSQAEAEDNISQQMQASVSKCQQVSASVSINDNDNEDSKESEYIKQQQKQQASAHTCVCEGSEDDEKPQATTDEDEQERKVKLWLQNFAGWWNNMRKKTGTRMKPIGTIDFAKRREGIANVVRKYGVQNFMTACVNAQNSPLCNGLTKARSSPVEFDWALLKEENFVRLLEGNL